MVETATLAYAGAFLVSAGAFWTGLRTVLRTPRTEPGPPPSTHSHLVAREVVDDAGQARGETVRVQGEDVVLKGPEGFLVVRRDALAEDGERLRAAAVDWDEARRRGEAWAREHEDAMAYDDRGLPAGP